MIWPHASPQEGKVGTGLINKPAKVQTEGGVWSPGRKPETNFCKEVSTKPRPLMVSRGQSFQVSPPPSPCQHQTLCTYRPLCLEHYFLPYLPGAHSLLQTELTISSSVKSSQASPDGGRDLILCVPTAASTSG